MKIDDIKINKTIGYGLFGTIFEVEDKKHKKYALKIEHILNPKKFYSRENEFALKMGSKYPDQFMTLYDYKIIDNCQHEQQIDISGMDKKWRKKFEKLAESEYCIQRLYSLIDTSLDKIVTTLNQKEFYSFLIQYSYIVYLMKKHKYSHNDFHSGNIGVNYVKNKYIKILGHNVPTFGYCYCAIDHGSVTKLQPGTNDMLPALRLFVDNKLLWDKQNKLIKKYGKKYMAGWNSKDKEDLKAFRKMPEKQILEKITDDLYSQFYLCQIMFPKVYQEIVLWPYFDGKVFDTTIRIPLEDILYFVINVNKPIKIIDYFVDKLTNI